MARLMASERAFCSFIELDVVVEVVEILDLFVLSEVRGVLIVEILVEITVFLKLVVEVAHRLA